MIPEDNAFTSLSRIQDNTKIVDVGTVRSGGDGVVELYTFHAGRLGDLIGTERVHAGANSDVRIDTRRPVRGDVMAVLKVDGQIVATHQFRNINR
ncbi:hypothetical protein SAMN04488567_1789 [Limimaricola pyoseonensis]|uniref:Uncharacterized protein n=2 Tax=Limimaricola pyoseonensis TaxID=521013 RepID=A0A1G7D4N6_9RHOB|nr:hypothetical protein SAMN04488567_1789 [Limimaricola pyoseonensis]